MNTKRWYLVWGEVEGKSSFGSISLPAYNWSLQYLPEVDGIKRVDPLLPFFIFTNKTEYRDPQVLEHDDHTLRLQYAKINTLLELKKEWKIIKSAMSPDAQMTIHML